MAAMEQNADYDLSEDTKCISSIYEKEMEKGVITISSMKIPSRISVCSTIGDHDEYKFIILFAINNNNNNKNNVDNENESENLIIIGDSILITILIKPQSNVETKHLSKDCKHLIYSILKDIINEEIDQCPIYQCISYILTEMSDDHDILAECDIDNTTIDDTFDAQFINDEKTEKNEKKKNKNIMIQDKEMITLYSWGNKTRKNKPNESEYNMNVCNVIGYKPKGINLAKYNGKNKEIQNCVENGKNYEKYKNNIIKKIESEKLKCVSVNCHQGRHRSVAFIELIGKELSQMGYQVKIIHLEIK